MHFGCVAMTSAETDGHVMSAKVVIGSEILDSQCKRERDGDLSTFKCPVHNIVLLKETEEFQTGSLLIDLSSNVLITERFNLLW